MFEFGQTVLVEVVREGGGHHGDEHGCGALAVIPLCLSHAVSGGAFHFRVVIEGQVDHDAISEVRPKAVLAVHFLGAGDVPGGPVDRTGRPGGADGFGVEGKISGGPTGGMGGHDVLCIETPVVGRPHVQVGKRAFDVQLDPADVHLGAGSPHVLEPKLPRRHGTTHQDGAATAAYLEPPWSPVSLEGAFIGPLGWPGHLELLGRRCIVGDRLVVPWRMK
uniref:Uncharacterized protein n=1 Tax=Candidatus Kentrum sp. FM TaxID=2126340 RepID=A0A450SU06_9GAMM|nr:MAG: hypothetical protein BECKFM1743C_GA0114222_102003 [Candidatus Kentron sp. FM]VFJ57703.1 MAG: hypothetical protein BECKFM1743A_GA0114220_101983 [Candidatus Kentron sp. FM]VFK11534.1 MAG: hypothetical protein BECKFM1743B_GA0114221_101894 [Candidatus Kentron sp. FM]